MGRSSDADVIVAGGGPAGLSAALMLAGYDVVRLVRTEVIEARRTERSWFEARLGDGQVQGPDLARSLGCGFSEKGTARTGPYESTHFLGLYVAGDASRAVQWVVVAAAEGAEAAFAINQDLLKADRQRPADGAEPRR